jgi:hypothetical protein
MNGGPGERFLEVEEAALERNPGLDEGTVNFELTLVPFEPSIHRQGEGAHHERATAGDRALRPSVHPPSSRGVRARA